MNDENAGAPLEPLLDAVDRDTAAAAAARDERRNSAHNGRVDLARGGIIAALGLAASVALAATRPAPVVYDSARPDPFGGALSSVIFENEFNRLPVEERLDLIRGLLEQMRSMDSGSSAMLAAFAAGIKNEAREQLETNARTLMVDFVDLHAKRYASAAGEERERMLDESLRDMVTLQRELFGQDAEDEDVDEGVENARKDAKREEERAAEDRTRLDGGEAAGFMRWAQNESEDTGPNQRARVTLFMRDMTRHMRGQDLDTGKPK